MSRELLVVEEEKPRFEKARKLKESIEDFCIQCDIDAALVTEGEGCSFNWTDHQLKHLSSVAKYVLRNPEKRKCLRLHDEKWQIEQMERKKQKIADELERSKEQRKLEETMKRIAEISKEEGIDKNWLKLYDRPRATVAVDGRTDLLRGEVVQEGEREDGNDTDESSGECVEFEILENGVHFMKYL